MTRDRVDLLFRDCLLVDGTGAPPARSDVAVDCGVIERIGKSLEVDAVVEIDLAGRVLAPGFIDIHAHSDFSVLAHPASTSKVLQGVTTEVVGNCGIGVVPVDSSATVELLRPLLGYCDDSRVEWDWRDVTSYRARLDSASPLVDVKILAGHNAIRASVMGLEARVATPEERQRMESLLDEALDQGALGMSLGLMYPPSSFADREELVALGAVLARHDAFLAVHMRDYGARLPEAVQEMVDVAEQSGCRLQISHMQVSGRENWGKSVDALEVLDAAAERGVDVAADFYPYLAGSTNLSQMLPLSALTGGFARFRARLVDEDGFRDEVLGELRAHDSRWPDVLLVSVPSDSEAEGFRVSELAATAGQSPEVCALELLRLGDPTMIVFGRSEDDLRRVMTHPRTSLGSDGLAVETRGTLGGPQPHPRFFGAFPALLQRFVREEPVLTLEDAIRRCTAANAARLGLDDRGIIAPGLRADLVVFDSATIADRSTYTDSRQVPAGIDAVYREGVCIASGGRTLANSFVSACNKAGDTQ